MQCLSHTLLIHTTWREHCIYITLIPVSLLNRSTKRWGGFFKRFIFFSFLFVSLIHVRMPRDALTILSRRNVDFALLCFASLCFTLLYFTLLCFASSRFASINYVSFCVFSFNARAFMRTTWFSLRGLALLRRHSALLHVSVERKNSITRTRWETFVVEL